MKKRKQELLYLSALLTLFLVGCQSNSSQSTDTSESQTSVSSKASSEKEEAKEKESSKEESESKEKEEEKAAKEEKTESESQAEDTEAESSANESTATSLEDQTTDSDQQGIDIDQIQAGDFSTLVGTWRNGRGQELVIHEDGYVEPHSFINLDGAKREGQFLVADLRATDGYWGGAAFYIIPAGVEVYNSMDHLVDASDKSRDRLLGGHTYDMIEYPEEFFYRVD
ncbi:DUF6287 domain-containing protein [Aerococcus mictus]|uniref:DUF6287 domain-containing protein n=1 Tax=Aerococcus mictus TaxID=2976810 RepID=UPI000DCB6B40|nr:DUF6287 domain-containing protein [Aerococcus mictus]KAA9233712.1 hypothetical protein F6I37_04775 [Aerococcus mictus]MDL5183820.1 DUF6287 domain-containing protein [Aerococcus mictus]